MLFRTSPSMLLNSWVEVISFHRDIMRAGSVVVASLMILVVSSPIITTSAQGAGDSVIINEIYVSPNSEEYGGIDWNGDGEIGRFSNQFLELHNPTDSAIDIGGWWIDDLENGGSPMCSIAWGTVIEPGAYVVFYRAQTNIEFDYWEGDTVTISDGEGLEIDSVSYPPEDSDFGTPYGYGSDGGWAKLSDSTPTPGGANDQEWVGVNHLMGNCYPPEDHIHRGEYILEGRVVTMESQTDVIDDGRILIRDGVIEEVWSSSEPTPSSAEGVVSIPTSGTIYPGFIDPHNHAHYNIIPLWDHGTDGWQNRYQWQADDAYRDAKDVGCSTSDSSTMRFAELRAIAGGNTAIQGSSTSNKDTFQTMLARNIEYYNFGKDQIHTKVTEIESDYEGNHIKQGNSNGNLDAWFIHLAEGIDESSRSEFDVLVQNDLLVEEIVIIHGTGLTQPELSALGDIGGSLAWSPTSNLLLYGETTDVYTAKSEGVNIMIGPDWSPSGSKSSMHELKIADWWDRNVLGDIFSDYELVQTITTNVVDAIGWSDHTGRIQSGLAADLVVLDTFEADPYRNVIEAIDPDVRLVVVGGLPVFGDVDIMQALDDEVEIIQGDGFRKAIDITYDGVPEAQQTFSEMMEYLSGCNEGKDVPIEYLFTMGDDRYFDVLNRTPSFQNGRSIDLWTEFYDVELDEDGHRIGGTVGGADPIATNISQGGGEPIVPRPVLPDFFNSFGPRGGYIAHPTSLEDGVHLEECISEHPSLTDRDGEQILCGSILIVMEETEECIISGESSFCMLDVSEAFTVPGRICTDAGVYPEEVSCRHNVEYVQNTGPDNPLPGENQESSDGFFTPSVIIGIILLVSFVALFRKTAFGSLIQEEE